MSTTNPDVQHTDSDGRARTWLKPGQVDQMRDVCLTDAVPTYLQDRNEAIVALLYDAGRLRSYVELWKDRIVTLSRR